MSDQLITSIVTVITAIIGVAILAVLVSPKAQTSAVIGAASRGFAADLGAALAPVSGGGLGINLPTISFQ
jgi:PRD1 phage membrane DNA delivery